MAASLIEGGDLPTQVRILHISDTHGKHRSIESDPQTGEAKFPFPPADVIIHTGDFTDSSSDKEFIDFNAWCGELKSRYAHIVIIPGNHEYSKFESPAAVVDREYIVRRLTNYGKLPLHCTVLEHETYNINGLRIFGSSWVPWHDACNVKPSTTTERKVSALAYARKVNPKTPDHFFDLIPPNTDILLTHGPPFGILDSTGNGHWGGSKALVEAIYRIRPTAHFFGHLHEQRGTWVYDDATKSFSGNIEFSLESFKGDKDNSCVFDYDSNPPPEDYPVKFTSCNAMLNNVKHEMAQLEHDGAPTKGIKKKIAGPARLIIAQRSNFGEPWVFSKE